MSAAAIPTRRATGVQQSVVVYAPKGSGKTVRAEQLRRHFGLTKIVEEENTPAGCVYKAFSFSASALYLSDNPPPPWFLGHRRVLSLGHALMLLNEGDRS